VPTVRYLGTARQKWRAFYFLFILSTYSHDFYFLSVIIVLTMDLSLRLSEKNESIKESIKAEVLKSAEFTSLLPSAGGFMGLIPPDRKASEALKSSCGWVYACVSAIADEIASIKIRLFQKKGEEVTEILEHPAIDIIQRCNEFTTKFDHFWLTTQYLELTGEAPWFITKDNRGQPIKLLLLRPDCIDIIPGTNGQIINGYEYMAGTRKINLAPDEVVFLRYPDPNKQFRGRSPLQAVARTVDLEEYAEEYNRKFFYNSARPDGVLSTEQKLGEEQLKKVETKLKQKYQGIGNAHKTLILEKGLKWESMSLSQKDMEFLGQANFARDKILGVFRVPRTVLGITEDVNRANAEATDYVFAKRTIKPKMERIVQQMNEFLLPLFTGTENMFYDFDNPVEKDVTANVALQSAALQNGWLTINEVRALDGYDPVDGGDELRIPAFRTPISEEGMLPPEFRGMNTDERMRNVRARTRASDGDKIRSLLEKKVAEEIKRMIGKKKNLQQKNIPRVVNPKAMEFQNKQLNIADEFEKKYTTSVTKVFRSQRDWVLARMPAKSAKGLDWQSFLLSSQLEKRRFAKELSALVTKIIIDQATEAFAFVGVEQAFDEKNPALVSYLKNRAFKFATPVTQLTNKLLGDQLKEGISAGEGIPKLRKRVEDVFGKMEVFRSERIARSETIRATNYSTLEAYKQSGVVEGQEWLATEDERTCEYCGPMDGKVLSLDDSWFKRGETLTGDRGGILKLDYEKIEHPPLHVNCRCTLIPVIAKSSSERVIKHKIDILDKKLDTLIQHNHE
jgi:HK97 family phage portal protein